MKQTMQILKNALVLLLVELLCWQVCFAQVDPWERIKLIEQGKKVAVKLQSGKTLNGKMEAWSPEGISVWQGKDRVVQAAKAEVTQVAMVGGMSRATKGSYAFLVGGGAGAVLGVVACADGCTSAEVGAVITLWALLIGGIAAGIAALFPQHKEVIYTAAPK